MELTYENFNGLNILDEIKKINEAEIVNINVTTTDKGSIIFNGYVICG